MSAGARSGATDGAAWWLGAATLCAVGYAALQRPGRAPAAPALPAPRAAAGALQAAQAGAARPQTARLCHGACALLAGSVLADSALEHYRGQFTNPGMFASLLAAGMTLAAAGRAALAPPAAAPARRPAYRWALLVGLAGTGFHLHNVRKRPGGISWGNVFYGAPLGAPAALALAGLIGLTAERAPPGRLLCALAGAGLAGTSAEAGLLHFRGAYHHRAMWLPVTVAPVGALLLGAAALAPPRPRRAHLSRAWLALTGALGLAGVLFHARGIARRMGGWRNWSQNLQAGPPLPAPPAFAALALAGYAALRVLDAEAAR